MPSALVIGIILVTGFLFGELVQAFRLPRITGYILAGIALNPGVVSLIPADFASHTDLATDIALAFITFSVGGSLRWERLRKLGRTIVAMTLCEAEFALLLVTAGFLVVAALPISLPVGTAAGAPLLLALLLGILASPTDPTATLAVTHQYGAKGDVTSTVMGIAASDDVLGVVNFSLGLALANLVVAQQGVDLAGAVAAPLVKIGGGILAGAGFGYLFNRATVWFARETEGELNVLIFGMLGLCYGGARLAGVDELLATMAMGCVVVNFNARQEKIFSMLERYQEELIFVFFFTLSGMRLNLPLMLTALPWIALFVVLRALGKTLGAYTGARLTGAPPAVRRYAFLGLLPQGGIVIGLALILHATPQFRGVADLVMAIIIGATVVHEIAGPAVARLGLRKAGELQG